MGAKQKLGLVPSATDIEWTSPFESVLGIMGAMADWYAEKNM